MEKRQNRVQLFNKSDLGRRWGETRQNVNNRARRHTDFPAPFAVVENGRMEIFALPDVVRYERARGLKINAGGTANEAE